MKLLDWKSGWKTYATVATGIGLGIVQFFNPHFHVPAYVDWGLSFLGLGFLRMGVSTAVSQQVYTTAGDVARLIALIMPQIQAKGTVSETEITAALNRAQLLRR